MCGGLGSRMQSAEKEKPMIELAGRSLVERVLDALKGSGRFSRIVAAVSPATPRTREFLLSRGVEVIDTPGGGYPRDLSFLLSRLAAGKERHVLVVPADLPLLTAEAVGRATELLLSSALGKKEREAAASIVMEKSFVEGLGISPSVLVDDGYCHSGITLFSFFSPNAASGDNTKEIKESYITFNRIELAVNVNTKREKERAERLLLLVERAQDLTGDKGL
jgi:adenosylcobinamide-phosphate guanylyltransferase